MVCKKCGKELADDTVFCQFCGQKQSEGVTENVENKEENISNKQLMLAGAIMAAVILAVIAVFKLVGREQEKDTVADMAVEESAETVSEEQQKEKPKETADSIESETAEGISEAAEPEAKNKPQISHIVIGEDEYWFDEDGDLIRAKDEAMTVDVQYLTDPAGNKVEITERMRDMDAIPEIGGEIYAILCNTKGHLLKSWNCDYGGGDTTRATYTHDGENIAEIQMTERQGDRIWRQDFSFQYDEGGDQIIFSEHVLDSDEEDSWEYLNVYTCSFEGNKLTECTLESTSGDSPWQSGRYIAREYDENGNLVREQYDHSDNTEETVYQYDEAGNLIRSDMTEKRTGIEGATGDEFTENTVSISVYQYDTSGNMVKEETETQSKREDSEYDDYKVIDYQYNENGKKVQERMKEESANYDENGAVVKQSSWERNYIWEYDAEDKLIYCSSLASSTGNDVVARESEYLYDEQGRLIEILIGGETTMVIRYTDEEALQQIDLVKEIEGRGLFEWSMIENLFPAGEATEMDLFSRSGSFPLKGDSIVLEYR